MYARKKTTTSDSPSFSVFWIRNRGISLVSFLGLGLRFLLNSSSTLYFSLLRLNSEIYALITFPGTRGLILLRFWNSADTDAVSFLSALSLNILYYLDVIDFIIMLTSLFKELIFIIYSEIMYFGDNVLSRPTEPTRLLYSHMLFRCLLFRCLLFRCLFPLMYKKC